MVKINYSYNVGLKLYMLMCLLFAVLFNAQGASEVRAKDISYPLDKKFIEGELKNGLRYFVKENTYPENKIIIQLAVKAGSAYEEEDQQGIAHFLEHLAFNGTKNFPGTQVIDFMEQQGMVFGNHINASTGFYETRYFLEIPTENLNAVRTAMQIVRDWLFYISFDPEEIDKERGVVLSELRSGLGVQEERMHALFSVLYKNSKAASRFPVGKKEQIESFTQEDFLRFYKRWYHPENAMLIVVGSLDAEVSQTMVEKIFSEEVAIDFEAPDASIFEVPLVKRNPIDVINFEHDQIADDILFVYFNAPQSPPPRTVDDLKQELLFSLMGEGIYVRFNDFTLEQNTPFFQAGYGSSSLHYSASKTHVLYGVLNSDLVKEGAQQLSYEIERLRRFGLTKSEVDKAKEVVISWYTLKDGIEDKIPSSAFVSFAGEAFYSNNYSALVDKLWLSSAIKELVEGIEAQDINNAIFAFLNTGDVTVNLEGKKRKLEKEEILNIYRQSLVTELEEPIEEIPLPEIVFGDVIENVTEQPPIVSEKYFEEAELHKLKLSNGITVYYKNTDLEDNTIHFTARKKAGIPFEDIEKRKLVYDLVGILKDSGVANLSAREFYYYYQKLKLDFDMSLRQNYIDIAGSSKTYDFEILLKLLYELIVYPKFDEIAIENFVKQYKNMVIQSKNVPDRIFFKRRQKLLHNFDPLLEDMAFSTLDSVTPEILKTMFQAISGNFNDFKFIFVGNIDKVEFKTLISKYIAALPSDTDAEPVALRPRDLIEAKKNMHLEFESVEESVTIFDLIVHDREDMFYFEKHLLLSALQILLQNRVTDVLREDLGMTYSPQVDIENFPLINRIRFSALITHKKAERDSIIQSIERIAENISLGNISLQEMQNVRTSLHETYKSMKTDNNMLLSLLQWILFEDKETYLEEIFFTGYQLEKMIEEITAEKVFTLFQRLQTKAGYLTSTLSKKD